MIQRSDLASLLGCLNGRRLEPSHWVRNFCIRTACETNTDFVHVILVLIGLAVNRIPHLSVSEDPFRLGKEDTLVLRGITIGSIAGRSDILSPPSEEPKVGPQDVNIIARIERILESQS
jgi:hypothetical protein